MKWIDKQRKTFKTFEKIQIGEGFEYEDVLYIKINIDYGFDVINNTIQEFRYTDKVYNRDIEIVFY